jgi:predicted nucleic acid-binding protein
MHAEKIFLDSNVLLYARDKDHSAKADRARHWLRVTVDKGLACANLQVLNEVTNVMLRKRHSLSAEDIFMSVDELRFLGIDPIDENITRIARRIRRSTSYSWWDCILLAAALDLGCTHFLSEDLQDGQRIEGLTIVDPFAHSPEQILVSR